MQSRSLFFPGQFVGNPWLQNLSIVKMLQLTQYRVDSSVTKFLDSFFMFICVITVCSSVAWI
jgi:hypothetical protein